MLLSEEVTESQCTPSVPEKELFPLPEKSTTFNFGQIYLTKY
jgi:hypothetical protein